MKIDTASLPDDPAKLKQLIAQMQSRYNLLEEKFRLAQQKQFGKSSETFSGQGELFNEAEDIAESVVEEEKQVSGYTRKQAKRSKLPADLPRETIVHDLADEEKICDCCQGELHKIGEDKAEKLKFIPASCR